MELILGYLQVKPPFPQRLHGLFCYMHSRTVLALDGTHIPARVPEEQCAAYQNQKGQLSQNVLAACNTDMKFTYILSGWEVSTANGRVFEDAHSPDFTIPEG